MWRHVMSFHQLHEVEGVENEQQRPQNGSVRHTAHGAQPTNVLRPTDQIRPKPPMRVSVDAEGLLQALQHVVIDGVEGCCRVKEN